MVLCSRRRHVASRYGNVGNVIEIRSEGNDYARSRIVSVPLASSSPAAGAEQVARYTNQSMNSRPFSLLSMLRFSSVCSNLFDAETTIY